MATETNAHVFFRDHVLSAIEDWQSDETAIHKAMLVATNLAHMADYYWQSFSNDTGRVFGKRSLSDFRHELETHYPDYALIRDVCDAHKHLELHRSPKRVTRASQTTTGRLGWDEAKWDDARWGSPEEVVVTDDSGEKHHFVGLVLRTEEMWRHLLN
ncbi:MAG: hypothetical protein ABI856_08740 [Nitrospira sp.]